MAQSGLKAEAIGMGLSEGGMGGSGKGGNVLTFYSEGPM